MDLQHTEMRRMLADSLRRFFADRYTAEVRRRCAAPPGHDAAIWKQLVELGAVGALFGAEDGGFGGAGFDIMVVFEELGGGLVVEPMLGTLMAGRALSSAGHGLRHAVVAGDTLVAFAHQETGSCHELALVETRAMAVDGGWSLAGTKTVVAGAEAASHALVSARTQGDAADPSGIALLLVPLDAAGVERRPYPLIDGGRAAELVLREVRVGADAVVAAAGDGFGIIEHATGLGVLALCAEGLGLMESLKASTVDYLGTRVQFDAPIGSNQALQHRMVDLLIDIEQARSAVINAAAALGGERATRERALSAAKYTIGVSGIRVAEEAIQMHGGIGMTQELRVAQSAKRLIMIDHQLGDSDHHIERFVELGRMA